MKLVITLTPASDISADQRHAAQERYRELLEEVFGGPEAVWKRYEAALASAQQGQERSRLPQQALRDLLRWEEAAGIASKLALGGIHVNGANFSFDVSRLP